MKKIAVLARDWFQRYLVATLNSALQNINQRIVICRRCLRLVEYREHVAHDKKREFRDWKYWGRPVPSFGDPRARLLVIGLAPAAHGGNRTGRIFTGDSSGQWLFRALHRAGFANQPMSKSRNDGLRLRGCYINAVIHCAPPDNKPLPDEIENCSSYFAEELAVLLPRLRVVIALGKLAFDHFLKMVRRRGRQLPRPLPRFAHGAIYQFGNGIPNLIASYHPSRQNTQTGKLSEDMLDDVFRKARQVIEKQ